MYRDFRAGDLIKESLILAKKVFKCENLGKSRQVSLF